MNRPRKTPTVDAQGALATAVADGARHSDAFLAYAAARGVHIRDRRGGWRAGLAFHADGRYLALATSAAPVKVLP